MQLHRLSKPIQRKGNSPGGGELELALEGGDGVELLLPERRDVGDDRGNDLRTVGHGQGVEKLEGPERRAEIRPIVLEPGHETGVVYDRARRAMVGMALLPMGQDDNLR